MIYIYIIVILYLSYKETSRVKEGNSEEDSDLYFEEIIEV